MQIVGQKIVNADTCRIEIESKKLAKSRTALVTQTQKLANAGDTMLYYTGGEFRMVYHEVDKFIQGKMGLLCDIIEKLAQNNISYAKMVEEIDKDAAEKAIGGKYDNEQMSLLGYYTYGGQNTED